MTTFEAIFENGVLKPTTPVDLTEGMRFDVTVRPIQIADAIPSQDEVYSILSRRFHSGNSKVASEHNEHQP